ncbi:MAG: HEAT repeat domain-containing protein [Polyangiaceae bacterium]|nr:HEAT repeat domain-containing protein [Polyangiaceae bacterium]
MEGDGVRGLARWRGGLGFRGVSSSRALLTGVGLALALPVAAAPSSVPPRTATSFPISVEIAAARSRDPASFERFRAARRKLADGEADPRRAAQTALVFRGSGGALWPLVEAVEEATSAPATRRADVEVELGVVEALGSARDPRALPALTNWLTRCRGDPRRTRAGVAAIGRIGDDAAVDLLLALADERPDDAAVFAGLGECRRARVAERLGRDLRVTSDPAQARILVRSLRDVASARVWSTRAVRESGEGEAVRTVAVGALLDAAGFATPALCNDIAMALVAIDHPSTARWFAELRARGTTAERSALDAVAGTMARLARLARH